MDSATNIRKQIYHYIEQADERVLRMVYAMLNQDEKTIVAYTTNGKPLTKSDYRKELALSEKEIEQGRILSQEDLEKEIEKW